MGWISDKKHRAAACVGPLGNPNVPRVVGDVDSQITAGLLLFVRCDVCIQGKRPTGKRRGLQSR